MWEILASVAALLCTLIGVIYGILMSEIRTLRKRAHELSNMVEGHEMLIAVMRKKLDI